jgi:hypothetical protein
MVESWDKQTAVPEVMDNIIRAGDFIRMRGDLATKYYYRETGIIARVTTEQNGMYTICTGEGIVITIQKENVKHSLEKIVDLEILKILYKSADLYKPIL